MKHFNELFHKNIIQKITIYGSVITLTGTDGTADITINDIPNKVSATFLTDLTTTAANWVASNIEHYEYHGYSVSASSGVITVTPKSGWDTVNRINATISNLTEDLSGTLTGVFEPDFSKADIWDVTFTMNSTVANPRNPTDGNKMDLILVGTGSYTLSWGDGWVSDNSITTIDTNIVTIKVRQVDGLSYAKSSFSWSLDWTTLTSGLIIYRKGIRSGFYVIDYSADGGVTWELDLVKLEIDEDSIIISIDDGVEGYRHEVRGDAYCIDAELTATGFEGAEDTDWENVYIIIK